MPEFTAQDVKSLRDATGAGMMDCKKALTEADGDRDKAARILREKGLSKVATLEDRENNQGAIAIVSDERGAALVELKSETDFSAKSDDFVALAQKMAEAVLADGPDAVAGLAEDLDTLKISKKENIELGTVARVEAVDGRILDAYLHVQDGRGTNGVIIELDGGTVEQAHEIALRGPGRERPVRLRGADPQGGQARAGRAQDRRGSPQLLVRRARPPRAGSVRREGDRPAEAGRRDDHPVRPGRHRQLNGPRND